MTKDEFDIPQGQLLFSAPTDKHNGTLIRIPIKEHDHSRFKDEVDKQLSYVDNLYINTGDHWYPEANDFTILKGDGWLYRPDSNSHSMMHLCLDRITYSIDWTELGMRSINFPCALKFNTGELIPTPSRESIVYTDKAKQLIKDRIQQVRDHFTSIFDEQLQATDNIDVYLKERGNSVNYVTINEFQIGISEIVTKSSRRIKFKPFDDIGYDPPRYWNPFEQLFRNVGRVNGNTGTVSMFTHHRNQKIGNEHFFSNNRLLELEKNDRVDNRNMCYILENHYGCQTVQLIRRNKIGLQKLKDILYLKNYSRDKWMLMIRAYCENFIPYVDNKIQAVYSDYLMHPNWEKTYAAGKSKYSPAKSVKSKNEISVTRFNAYSENMTRGTMYLDGLPKLLIYSSYEDREKMQKLGTILCRSNTYMQLKNPTRMQLVVLSKENLKYMEDVKNKISLEEVISGDYKVFRKIITGYMIYERYQCIKYMENIPETINFDMKEKAIAIKDFMERYTKKINEYGGLSSGDSFILDCVAIAKANNIFDQNIINDLEKLEKYCDGLEILAYTNLTLIPEKVLMKFFKDNSKRISNSNYLKNGI